jgi:N-acetyl-anhydromuramyl-L-alanine amidase AmpD
MSELLTSTKLLALPVKKFWSTVTESTSAKEIWEAARNKVAVHGAIGVSQAEALEALDALFIYTHQRILQKLSPIAPYYPTTQFTSPFRRNLVGVKNLFWVDHFTAGVRLSSTLTWFSSKKQKATGKVAMASTHFVLDYHDDPYYIIPIAYCAWHVPVRNKDSIGIEMVNAGPVKNINGKWNFHAGVIPQEVLIELTPEYISPAYKGSNYYLPYTQDQILNNTILKRIIIAALPGKLSPERMTVHSDWQVGKCDTGPLWPRASITHNAFSNTPLISPHIGWSPYQEEELSGDARMENDDNLLNIENVQKILYDEGYDLEIDGVFGPKTHAAVRAFQAKFNLTAIPADALTVDGIPGPLTCAQLIKAAVKNKKENP